MWGRGVISRAQAREGRVEYLVEETPSFLFVHGGAPFRTWTARACQSVSVLALLDTLVALDSTGSQERRDSVCPGLLGRTGPRPWKGERMGTTSLIVLIVAAVVIVGALVGIMVSKRNKSAK